MDLIMPIPPFPPLSFLCSGGEQIAEKGKRRFHPSVLCCEDSGEGGKIDV